MLQNILPARHKSAWKYLVILSIGLAVLTLSITGCASNGDVDYNKAIDLLTEAIESNSGDDVLYYNRGTAYINVGQYEKAIHDLNKAIALNPKDSAYYINRGLAYSESGLYYKAIDDYTWIVVSLDPTDFEAYFNIANNYMHLKQYEVAIRFWDKTIELNPNYSKSYYGRGNAYRHLEQYDKALNDYDQSIYVDPDNKRAIHNRKLLLDSMKK